MAVSWLIDWGYYLLTGMILQVVGEKHLCLVVSNIFYYHPYMGKIPILTIYFSNGLKPPLRKNLAGANRDESFMSKRMADFPH